MNTCPCGVGTSYESCCGPIINGAAQAQTAEQTMRARYSAYAKHAIDFIESSHHPETKHELNRDEIAAWSSNANWEGLEIVHTDAGGEQDLTGVVEFIANYSVEGRSVQHREVSEFKKQDGVWYFYDGNPVPQTYKRSAAKVGRNDPCICGSGKKFKRCCG